MSDVRNTDNTIGVLASPEPNHAAAFDAKTFIIFVIMSKSSVTYRLENWECRLIKDLVGRCGYDEVVFGRGELEHVHEKSHDSNRCLSPLYPSCSNGNPFFS